MAAILAINQVEDQNDAPFEVNNQTSYPVPNLESNPRTSLCKDTSAEEKANFSEIMNSNANEVNWDGPDDVQNPQNWPVWRRVVIVGTVTSIVFTTYVHSTLLLSNFVWYLLVHPLHFS